MAEAEPSDKDFNETSETTSEAGEIASALSLQFSQSASEANITTPASNETFMSHNESNNNVTSGDIPYSPENVPKKSPATSSKDAVSDTDMNDLESFNDSAIPSSCLSESSAETKSNGSIFVDEKDEIMSVDRDEPVGPDCLISQEKHRSGTPVSGGKESPGAKRLPTDDEESPKSKRKTTETVGGAAGTSQDMAVVEGDTKDAEVVESGEDLSSLPSSGYKTSSSSRSSSTDENEENNTGSYNVFDLYRRRLNQRRRRRQAAATSSQRKNDASSSSSSSSSSDDDDDDGDNDNLDDVKTKDSDKADSSDDEVSKVVEEILSKPSPLPNWFAVREVRRREYGYSTRQNVNQFCERVQGSSQMVRKMEMFDKMNHHEGCVNALHFNRIGTLLASGSDDLNIVLWNWQRSRPSLIYESGHRSNVFQAKFMPYSGDCHVISCARDGQVRLAELSLTGICKATRKLAQHRGSAHKLALEHDSPNIFLSCGEDAVTYLFDLRDDHPYKLVTTKENDKKVPLYSIHSNPSNPSEFCVGGRDHFIRVYDKRKISEEVDEGVLKKFCPEHLIDSDIKANVTCACYNYNGTEILGSYNDEDIYLFDNRHSDGANYVHRYMGHRNNNTVKGVNFYGPNSEFIVSGSDCGNIYFWDKETEAILNFAAGDVAGVINVLEPHPTLPLLATSGLDSDVKLWMPGGGEPCLDRKMLTKTLKKNQQERNGEREIRPNVMSSQMLWMIMHHFRNTARRRMREEGHELSTDDEDDNRSDDSDNAVDVNDCAQS